MGHRGVRGAAPENTMAAFEEAHRQGADAVELDVLVCRSGEAVVIHDPTLERVTGGEDKRAVADLTYTELRRVDVGAGERVPLLSEVLAFARERRLAVNVEIKRETPNQMAVVAAAARLLRGWDPAHPRVVSCFDPFMLAAFGALAPRVPRALLVHRVWWRRYALALPLPLGIEAAHIERTIASPALVRRLKGLGLTVSVWTVNTAGEALDLAALGVDSLISDTPGEVLAALEASR
jgi:glycerophosphoryl diester phosphodiesterase